MQHLEEEELDKLIMTAFKMVLRGVKFFDVWNEDVALERSIDESIAAIDVYQGPTGSAPLTPPADQALFNHAEDAEEQAENGSDATREVSLAISDAIVVQENREQANTRYSRASHINVRPVAGHPLQVNSRPASAQTTRRSALYRASFATQPTDSQPLCLVSENLSVAHERFLTFLGGLLGLQLTSRTSIEILVTTHHAVRACQTFLDVIDVIWERDLCESEELGFARTSMYAKLSDLAQAVKDIFQPTSPSDKETPDSEDGGRLAEAATVCITGAGNCVAQARCVLEKIGDFEFEKFAAASSPFDGLEFRSAEDAIAEAPEPDFNSSRRASFPLQPSRRPPPPPPYSLPDESVPSERASDHPARVAVPRSEEEPLDPTPVATSPYSSPSPHLDHSVSADDHENEGTKPCSGISPTAHVADTKCSRTGNNNTSSTVSGSTCVGSLRDSDRSHISSVSTRGTSPDMLSSQTLSISSAEHSLNGSHSSLEEDCVQAEATLLEKTHAHELTFNSEGQVSGGTLPALIERLTMVGSTPDSLFVSVFFLTFRLFAPPQTFAQALIDRFESVSESDQRNSIQKPHPVHLRVFNVFKGWLESHWRMECDRPALDLILPFAAETLANAIPSVGKRLMDLALKVSTSSTPLVPRLLSSVGKTNTSTGRYVAANAPIPSPLMSKSQIALLKNWKQKGITISVLDFDPVELARQITIKESNIFCCILPEELLAEEWTKKEGSIAVNVSAIARLSTDLTNMVMSSILQLADAGKRAKVIKQWVKVADACFDLASFDCLIAILAGVTGPTIQRMTRTWELVKEKTKATIEKLDDIIDWNRNYNRLRIRLENHVGPCLPFMGMYLTDLTFIDVGNQATRLLDGGRGDETSASVRLINFDKHMRTAKIISTLQRFQIPPRLKEVPELQTWIQDQMVKVRSIEKFCAGGYYRRSLLLEPREPGQGYGRELGASVDTIALERLGSVLQWPHVSRGKVIAAS